MFVISAPSGAGKSTLVNALCEYDNHVQLSISHTTRPIRIGETHGVNYFFVTHQEFEEKLAKNEFLEYAKVYDHYYGTNINTINDFLATGRDIILEIDYQGAAQVKTIYPNAILIFIAPPSLEILEYRLTNRNTDSPEVIKKRMNSALIEIQHSIDFDYIVVNDDLDDALSNLKSIVKAARCAKGNMIGKIQKNFNI